MSTHVSAEQIESTKSEKLLAVLLAGFLLVGGLWSYYKIEEATRPSSSPVASFGSPAERQAIGARERAQGRLFTARAATRRATRDLELRREAYRTALDANQPAAGLEAQYKAAQAKLASAQARVRAAKAELVRTTPAARLADRKVANAERESASEQHRKQQHHDRNTFLIRFVLVFALFAFSLWLLTRVRERYPRWLAMAIAFVAFAGFMVLFLGLDYMTDYVKFTEMGPFVLSLLGAGITLLAAVALQRHIAKQAPKRRVRKSQCPFCGFPVQGNECCEGCGRQIIGSCSSCNHPRRVGTAHCGACGAT